MDTTKREIKPFEVIPSDELMQMDFSAEEKQAKKEKKAYKKRLNALTDDKEIKRKAKTISAQISSCNSCAYKKSDDDTTCYAPYSDGMMDDLNIDPCYEGVLVNLVAKEKEITEKHRLLNADIMEAVEDSMSIVVLNVRMANRFSKVLWKMAKDHKCDGKMRIKLEMKLGQLIRVTDAMLQCFRRTSAEAQEKELESWLCDYDIPDYIQQLFAVLSPELFDEPTEQQTEENSGGDEDKEPI